MELFQREVGGISVEKSIADLFYIEAAFDHGKTQMSTTPRINSSNLAGDFFPKRFLFYSNLVLFMASKSETKTFEPSAKKAKG